MKSSLYIFLCGFFVLFNAQAQQTKETDKYLNQTPPGLTPKIFAPGIISRSNAYEFGSVFNKNATAFYYGVDTNHGSEIRFSELKNGKWTKPKILLKNKDYGFNDPFLSNDENRLYFISKKALHGKGAKKDHDIWYVEKKSVGWSEPVNAGPNINTDSNEYYMSFTDDGTLYFSSNKSVPGQKRKNFDIYFSKQLEGKFQKAVRLGPSINTQYYEADVFIAPDNSYIIFCANRPGGLGRGDLYISFKNADGSWSKSMSMGDKINTKGHELCPFVSKDGKYFFYTSNQDIYWVSAKIIDNLRAQQK